jgi:hypothetical protein
MVWVASILFDTVAFKFIILINIITMILLNINNKYVLRSTHNSKWHETVNNIQ